MRKRNTMLGLVAMSLFAAIAAGCAAESTASDQDVLGQAQQAEHGNVTLRDAAVYDVHWNMGGAHTISDAADFMFVGKTSGTPRRSYMRFDLSPVPAGAVIDSATLRLHGSLGGYSIGVHEAYSQDVVVAHDTDQPGVTYDPAPLATLTVAQGVYNDIDMKGLVQEWVAGTAANDGILLMATDESATGQNRIVATDNADGSRRPELVIAYCYNPVPEVCNGIDDDCDGVIDDDPTDLGACTVGGQQGICSQGQEVCDAGSVLCVQTVAQATETCNGLDDDCDGSVDNVAGLGACTVAGQQGICAQGQEVCNGGVLLCNPTYPTPTQEVCNGLDDDCDGTVDEVCPGCTVDTYGGHSYLFCQNGLYPDEAAQVCANNGMVLTRVNSAAENAWILGHTTEWYCSGIWIGFREFYNTEEFYWYPDGENLQNGYTNWAPNHPANWGPSGIMQYGTGLWYEVPWNDQRPYVCESN